jgi:hypothetical protein
MDTSSQNEKKNTETKKTPEQQIEEALAYELAHPIKRSPHYTRALTIGTARGSNAALLRKFDNVADRPMVRVPRKKEKTTGTDKKMQE